jgi:hypothetical protein
MSGDVHSFFTPLSHEFLGKVKMLLSEKCELLCYPLGGAEFDLKQTRKDVMVLIDQMYN